ncbi:MAG: hypothetical protein ABFD25_14500 [Clostridiaceae bacterium]
MHKKLDGVLSSEKADFVINENKRLKSLISDGTYSREYQPDSYTGYFWGDYVMINKYFYDPMKYMSTYSVNIDKVVEKAKDNIAFYEKYGNNYGKAKNEFVVKNYSKREIAVFYDSKPWGLLFDYNFSDLLILLLMLLGFVPMFANEKETKMNSLILASKNGKINITLVKILSALVFVTFLVFVFSCENILVFKFLYGLNGHKMPLYAIEKYQYSSLSCSVSEFYFLKELLKIMGFFSFGMMIFMFSALFERVIYTYMLSALIMIGGIYVSGYLASVEFGKAFLSMLSPFTLLKGNELCMKLLDINILNHFFLKLNVTIFMQILIITMLFLLICKIAVDGNLKTSGMFIGKGGA